MQNPLNGTSGNAQQVDGAVINLGTSEQKKKLKPKKSKKEKTQKSLFKRFRDQWQLQVMIWPSIILLIIFSYIPMLGIVIVFQDYSPIEGFFNSTFVGLQNFQQFLSDSSFYQVLKNTMGISLLKLLFEFPASIILAILISELAGGLFKKISQTISYLPHFLAWTIFGGMLISWLSSNGLLNNLLLALHLISKPTSLLTDSNAYWWIATFSDLWKEVGWGTILYLAAIAGIDPTLYEAAVVDGASRLRRIWNITLPGILPIVTLMFVLAISGIVGSNLDQTLMLQNTLNMPTSEVVDSFVFHTGLGKGSFSYAAAVGLFTSFVSIILLLLANFATKKINKTSIF